MLILYFLTKTEKQKQNYNKNWFSTFILTQYLLIIIKQWGLNSHTYPKGFTIVLTWNLPTSVYQFSKGRLLIYHCPRILQLFYLQMLMPNVSTFYIKYNKSFNMTKRYLSCLNNTEYWHETQSLKWRWNIAWNVFKFYKFWHSFYVTRNYIYYYKNIKCILLFLWHDIVIINICRKEVTIEACAKSISSKICLN